MKSILGKNERLEWNQIATVSLTKLSMTHSMPYSVKESSFMQYFTSLNK